MPIKTALITTLAVFGTAITSFAQDAEPEAKYLAFEKKTDTSEEQLYLIIDGEFVRGTLSEGSNEGTAFGRVFGKVREDGVLHLTYNYTIEDQPGSEEQLMKLGKGEITIAEGELAEHGPNQNVLKDPKGVKFTKVLKQVPISLPKPESPEAEAVHKPVEAVVSKLTGVKCDTKGGFVRVAGDWALYQGYIAVLDEKIPADPEIAKKVAECEFQAQLKKDGNGWKVVRSIFASQIGSFDYEDISEENMAPWQLLEDGEGN